MRLIDADLLKENINNWYDLVNEYGQTRMTLSHDDILAKIDNMPTVCDIDAIRDEIKELSYPYNLDAMRTKSDVLQIIDRHMKGESDAT